MNIEKTMEFILHQQAKFEENFHQSNLRHERHEREMAEIRRVLAQNNRIVAKLASTGVSLRGSVRQHEKMIASHEKAITAHNEMLAVQSKAISRHEILMTEMEDKLNALIDFVDKQTRRNGSK